MTRLEKCIILKEKGYTYDPETGKIYGIKGKEVRTKNTDGYIQNRKYHLLGHHFAWYWVYGNVDFIELDHKNRVRDDNRICNLRILNRSDQSKNTNSKGCSWNKINNKWRSYITINRQQIHLGYFNTEEEAKQAYLEAKKKYHHI